MVEMASAICKSENNCTYGADLEFQVKICLGYLWESMAQWKKMDGVGGRPLEMPVVCGFKNSSRSRDTFTPTIQIIIRTILALSSIPNCGKPEPQVSQEMT